VIIMNKWIFQVCIFCLMLSLSLSLSLLSHLKIP
jgi:hypothetical protein